MAGSDPSAGDMIEEMDSAGEKSRGRLVLVADLEPKIGRNLSAPPLLRQRCDEIFLGASVLDK
jgi:hypothetical protein